MFLSTQLIFQEYDIVQILIIREVREIFPNLSQIYVILVVPELPTIELVPATAEALQLP